jgi:hypothetical protein
MPPLDPLWPELCPDAPLVAAPDEAPEGDPVDPTSVPLVCAAPAGLCVELHPHVGASDAAMAHATPMIDLRMVFSYTVKLTRRLSR